MLSSLPRSKKVQPSRLSPILSLSLVPPGLHSSPTPAEFLESPDWGPQCFCQRIMPSLPWQDPRVKQPSGEAWFRAHCEHKFTVCSLSLGMECQDLLLSSAPSPTYFLFHLNKMLTITRKNEEHKVFFSFFLKNTLLRYD